MREPDTGSLISIQLSMQFALAAALLHGEVGLTQIAESSRTDKRILDLMNRIDLVVDPLQEGGSAEPRLDIHTAEQSVTVQAVRARRAWTNRLSDDETFAKFVRPGDTRLSSGTADELIRLVMNLETARRYCAVGTANNRKRASTVDMRQGRHGEEFPWRPSFWIVYPRPASESSATGSRRGSP